MADETAPGSEAEMSEGADEAQEAEAEMASVIAETPVGADALGPVRVIASPATNSMRFPSVSLTEPASSSAR